MTDASMGSLLDSRAILVVGDYVSLTLRICARCLSASKVRERVKLALLSEA
jgi:hypothetical protein